MTRRARPTQVTCPRCGYDLRGQTTQWTSTCPLVGRCTECGLEFEWRFLFTRERHPWLFEYHWRDRPVRRFVHTAGWSVRPRRFWRDVHLTDPIRLRPMIVVLALLAIIWAGLQVGYLMDVLHENLQYQARTAWRYPWSTRTNSYLVNLLLKALQVAPAYLALSIPGPLVVLLGMPLAFLMLPLTLRRARVRPAHVLRIWCYGLMLPLLLALGWTTYELAATASGVRPLIAISRAINPRSWYVIVTGGDWQWAWWTLGRADSMGSQFLALLLLIWLGAWWTRACRDYLKLPQPRRVAIVLAVVVGLAALLVELLQDLSPWRVTFLFR